MANFYLMKNTMVAALGGLLFGFVTAVIAGTTRDLTTQYGLSPTMLGVTVSSALWGTVIGSIAAGGPVDRYGRRAALRILAVLYVISALGCALAPSWAALVFFRVIGGLAIGGSSVIGPMYIAEIAPAARRGQLVGFFQFNIVLGILVAYFSNYVVGLAGFGDTEWRWKLGIPAIAAALFLVALFGIPQSPRWLVGRGRMDEARQVLQRIGEADVEGELRSIRDSVGSEAASANEPLFRRKYRVPIFLAVSIGVFNQLSGINAVLYYLNDIFQLAGFDKVSSDLQAVAVGFTNLVATTIAMAAIDRLGRKKLLLTGAIGTGIALAGVAAVFAMKQHQDLLVWLLLMFIAFFAFSQGAVIWVYLSEVFPTNVRAKGQSLGSFTHWLMNAVISAIYPAMAAASGAVPFFVFAAMMFVQFFVVLMFYPETKGYSLEELQKEMVRAD